MPAPIPLFEEQASSATDGSEEPEALVHQARQRRRRSYLISAGLLLCLVGTLGVGAYIVWVGLRDTEEQMAKKAQAEYDSGAFREAGEIWAQLAQKTPDADKQELYGFMAELADLRETLAAPETTPASGLTALEHFVSLHEQAPLLAEKATDLGGCLLKLSQTFHDQNQEFHNEEPLALVGRFEKTEQLLLHVKKEAISAGQKQQLVAVLDQVRVGVEQWRKREQLLTQMQAAERSPMEGIHKVKRLLREKAAEYPGLEKDPRVQAILTGLYDSHRASVRYEHPSDKETEPAGPREDREPTLIFDPNVLGLTPMPARRKERVLLALARGVLYALGDHSGAVRWALRVGVDTTTLPVRVPASIASRERILVLSSDTQTLTALDTDGAALWQYRLSKPCLGRPIVIDQRAFLPTYDGQVHEIELAEGRLLGRFHLGQPLTVGGTVQPGTSRVYFPADDSCVYVLDVESHRCQEILYTGHPAGSLRSEPLVVASEKGPGYLILPQEHGLYETELRVFPLQGSEEGVAGHAERDAVALHLEPPARLPGWTWFEPSCDAEKVVVLSDTGMLGLFGIRQPGTRDQALFPLLRAGGIPLGPFLRSAEQGPLSAASAEPGSSLRGRSQIVQVEGDDYWVLAHGLLRRLQMVWTASEGPRLASALEWQEPLLVGSPQHGSQAFDYELANSTGRKQKGVFLVTQKLSQPTCLATAVNAHEGRPLWQRQLGVLFQGEPLTLPRARGSGSVLLVLDQSGGLFFLDPERFDRNAAWQSGGRLLREGIDGLGSSPPMLFRSPDGRSAYALAYRPSGAVLIVRHVAWKEDGNLDVTEHRIALPAPLAGRPAIVGSVLLLPLADRQLTRLTLPLTQGNASCDEGGPTWRDRHSQPSAPAYLLGLDEERFLLSDGGRGITCLTWPKGNSWTSLPRDHEPPTWRMKERVAAPPILLPASDKRSQRVLVADAVGELTLLSVGDDGSITPKGRSWQLDGLISGEPQAHKLEDGQIRVLCVLDRRKLLCIDPAREKPLWQYEATAALVGTPQLIGTQVLLANNDGRYVALDMHTGKQQGRGYQLRGSMAPLATPTPFDTHRLLAPLSDGTAMLLSRDHFKAVDLPRE